jgi:tetratricopeptide (TPR) repeat protein
MILMSFVNALSEIGMAVKFHKRQTTKLNRLTWFSKSGAVLVIRPRSARPARSRATTNPYLLPEDADRLLRQRALYAAQNGDCAFALKGFNHLINRHPDNAADYNNRGLVYFQSGQLALALADYNYAIALEPNLANVYNNRANYYAALGELTLAIEDYDQAIRIDPMNVRAWINQGITFREMELYDQAIENFFYALDINARRPHLRRAGPCLPPRGRLELRDRRISSGLGNPQRSGCLCRNRIVAAFAASAGGLAARIDRAADERTLQRF